MDVVLIPLIQVLRVALEIYIWCIIISAVLSWLIAFNVVNTSNRVVYVIGDFLYRITEPALRPLRRFLPNLGGIDLSPVVLILILWFFDAMLVQIAGRVAMHG